MNGFEKHGIKHLSPSSINMYAECAGAWASRYLFNKKFSFGVPPQIGVLTEQVVQDVLLGDTLEASVARANTEFNKRNALNTNEKQVARVVDIEAMATLALEELKPYGEPEFVRSISGVEQQKISITCKGHGWEIPVIGFLDFVYPKEGLIVDLKTTLRMPSRMSVPHQRQAAIYSAARGNQAVKFLYVTPKKTGWHEVEDNGPVLGGIKTLTNRMEKFLNKNSAEEIQEMVPVNAGSYYWTGEAEILKELYGL